MGIFSTPSDPALTAQLNRIERKLDAIMAHLVMAQLPADDLEAVRVLIASGQKIEAIKLYRELTGAGLAEAKAVIDQGL